MSDDENKEKDSKKKKKVEPKDPPEPNLVEPVAKDLELFGFLADLFDGQQEFPEKLDVRVVRGKDYAQMGPMVKQFLWPAGKPKPSKEELVKLSNEILHLLRRDADVKRKEAVYHVAAIHFSRDPEPYSRHLIRVKPGVTYRNGESGEENLEEDDETNIEKRHGVQILRHHETMFNLVGTVIENLVDRQDRFGERLSRRNDQLEARNERLADLLERALDRNVERSERLEWSRIKAKGAEKILEMGLAVAPPLLGALVGKDVVGAKGDSIEAYTLRGFLKPVKEGGALTEEQSRAAFGEWNDSGDEQTQPGVLTKEQVVILVNVARGEMPAEELDKLMPGATYGITGEQANRLMQVFPMDQLAPLMVLIETRRKRVQTQSTG
jgi:hypothetical protein